MRDISIILVLAILVPMALRFPVAGLYAWVWIAIMNPHRLVYGFAQNMPFNMGIAVVTGVAWLFSRERKSFEPTPFAILLIIFTVWISITTLAAPVPAETVPLWDRTIKTVMLILMVLIMINNRARVLGLVWLLAVSIGYYGVKGGLFMIITGGAHIVFGPMYTQIYDNNSLALASTMMIPIINYLRVHTPHKLLRLGLTAAMFFTTVSVIGSYSRGGIIAMAAMLLFLWAKSRTKVATMALAIFVGVIGISFMPEKYTDRISTIKTATEDESFKGRLDAWEVAWRTALDRPLGAGFDGPRQRVIWDKYLPDRWARASHSIYFMVLGEHGFIGLGIWLALIYAAWRNLVWVVKRTRGLDEMLWAKDLAQAIQVSMIGFMVGGAALPMAYYDGFFALLAIGTVLRLLVQREIGVAPRRVWWPKPATPSPAGTAPQVARTASP